MRPGQVIKVLRQRHGMTLAELARRISALGTPVPYNTLDGYERGHVVSPPDDVIDRALRVLGIPRDEYDNLLERSQAKVFFRGSKSLSPEAIAWMEQAVDMAYDQAAGCASSRASSSSPACRT